jgi:hypothetical protein
MKLDEHPLAQLFPNMSETGYRALKEDIEANGLQTPLYTWRGQLIDGRHRLKVCEELGVEPAVLEVNLPEEGLASFVWSLNGVRRHLTTGQRTLVAALMSRESKRGRPEPGEINAQNCAISAPGEINASNEASTEPLVPPTPTQTQAAKTVGVSRRYVQQAANLLRQDEPLAREVHQGHITLSTALKRLENTRLQRELETQGPAPSTIEALIDPASGNPEYQAALENALQVLTRGIEIIVYWATPERRPDVPNEKSWGLEDRVLALLEKAAGATGWWRPGKGSL